MLLAAIINPIADVEVVSNWDLEAKLNKLVSRRCPQLVIHFKSSRGPSQDKNLGLKLLRRTTCLWLQKSTPVRAWKKKDKIEEIKRKQRRNIGLDTRTNCQCQGRFCCYGNMEMSNKQPGNSKSCLSSPSLLGSSASFAVRVYQMFSKWEVRLQNPRSEVWRVCRNRDTCT